MKPDVIITDGGRYAAGYKGSTRDCVCRAIAVAFELPYREVYDLITEFAKKERRSKRKRGKSSPRTGVHKGTIRRVMDHLGATWTPTMHVGSGCKVHVRPDELPGQGRFVLSLSRHSAAWIDGKLYDSHDSSREGTRCVYGYWRVG